MIIHNKYYEVLSQFLKGYDKVIYGRELIGKLSIKQKNIAITLNELENLGVLYAEKRGNMKYFRLNTQNPSIGRYVMIAELYNSITFLDRHQKINQTLGRLSLTGVVCIFGSYAKKLEKKGSDLDILLVESKSREEIEDIGRTYNFSVSIKETTMKDMHLMVREKNELMLEIIENHILLSGYEEFVKVVLDDKH